MLITTGSPYHFRRNNFRFRLKSDLKWQDKRGNIITVPAGFISDGASIPKPLQFLFNIDDPNDSINCAAYIHDFPFTNNHQIIINSKFAPITLQRLDKLFYEILLDLGVDKATAFTLYAGVMVGSRFYW